MTVNEFSIQFDILLNQRYPNLGNSYVDEYEKSILLTKAQEEIVKQYADIFEQSEKARRALANIVRNVSIAYDSNFNATQANIRIEDNSKLFKLPADVKLIRSEHIVTQDNIRHSVRPITHDEYEDLRKNPFRNPNSSKPWDRALKLDLSYNDGVEQVIEILYPLAITSYNIRYIKYPVPIILEDVFPSEKFDDYYYDIRELSSSTTSELDNFVHEEILDIAVNKAAMLLNLKRNT